MRRLTRAMVLPTVLLGMAVPLLHAGTAPPANAASGLWTGTNGSWRGHCIDGDSSSPMCYFWQGKVTFVDDGDTVDVDIYGDGVHVPRRIRFTGIQAMEQHTYSHDPAKRTGECHSLRATARVEGLIRRSNWMVRLGAQDPTSHSGARLRRSVAVRIDGKWTDVGHLLLAEGHVMWLPNGREWAHNLEYNRLAQQARSQQLRLWNPDSCGPNEPAKDAQLRMWLKWDADGNDERNLNGEWVKFQNLDRHAALSLAGWWFRDSALRRFTFPRSAVIPPGGVITLHMGFGPDTARTYYWGQRRSVFDNVDRSKHLGDGGYLFDSKGNLRASMVYPCVYRCYDRLAGKVRVNGDVRRERIWIRNTSRTTIDLVGHQLETWPYAYGFDRPTKLGPGESLTLWTQGSPKRDTRLSKHWGMSHPILDNSGDVVDLQSYSDIVVSCTGIGPRPKSC